MLMKEKIRELIKEAAGTDFDFDVTYPDSKFGDYATNAALILAQTQKQNPLDVANSLMAKFDQSMFEKVEIAGPGFINFKLKLELLFADSTRPEEKFKRILVEYFSPNVAKPLHLGHLENAILGDSVSRMLKFLRYPVESDNHIGDWGTQFGVLILAYKKYGNSNLIEVDPIVELNKLYLKINEETEKHPQLHEEAKAEFVKLENGDQENRALWKKFVDWSVAYHSRITELLETQPFDNVWPESFYEDKMAKVVLDLKSKDLLKESQGAQVVDLTEQGLGIALIIKSDRSSTYLLRDLATFVYRKSKGFVKQLYVVDVRQSLAFKQLFAILKLLSAMQDDEAVHVDYGFMSFKGEVLSTRKGNMILAEDVIVQSEEKVSKIVMEKNPDLKNSQRVVSAVAKGAIKYFILKHNRHSDIEFNWDEALDFEGDSGPYLQYSYARLASILRKAQFSSSNFQFADNLQITNVERQILFQSAILSEIVEGATKEYLPNILAHYLYNFAQLVNKFYHESPVLAEKNEETKKFRLALILKAKTALGQGLDLLGITALDEM